MIRVRRFLYMAVVVMAMMFFATGCSNERQERQLQLREQGISYLENGQYEKALTTLQAALDESLGQIGEIELDICYYKAEAQYMLGNVEDAIHTYSTIIGYNNSSKAYYLRGNLYFSQGEEELALSDYESAIQYDGKDDYELYIGIYESMKANGNSKGDIYLDKAANIKGDTAYDKMQKGRIRFMAGAYGDAVAMLTEAAEGGQSESYYYLAEVYLATDKLTEAKSALESYIASGIADSYRLYHIADSQMEKENYDIAIECLESALKLEAIPNKQVVMKSLVIAYEKTYNFASARKLLEEYVNIFPEDEDAKRELTFLETR
ncbi:MAG: tetratricopeptide repeat protein [Agathobacter sp.]